jgi:hypothetical protein
MNIEKGKTMTKRVLLAIIFCLFVLPWVSGSASAFKTPDLAGTWYGYMAGVDNSGTEQSAYWLRLKLDINSSGTVATTSTYTDPTGLTQYFKGGSLALDGSGKLTGYLISQDATVTIQDGKMDRGKTIIGFTDTTDDDNLHEGKLIKAGGSFETGNLAGTWYGHYLEINYDSGDVYWVYATLNINSSGGVTGGSLTGPLGPISTFNGGTLTLNGNGILGGTVTTAAGNSVTFSHGKMDQGKTIVGFVDTTSNYEMDVGVFIKDVGSFATSDLQGTWHGYFTEIDTVSELGYWIYATLDIDSSGTVTGGTYTYPGSSGGTFTGGSLALNSSGKLTGNMTTSDGSTITIQDAKMDQRKTIIGFTDTTSQNKWDVGMFIKAGIAGSSVGSRLLLLLGD